jgi:hypothetical protein
MIYPDKKIANMILGKMKKHRPEDKWEIRDTPLGFQIVANGGFKKTVTDPHTFATTLDKVFDKPSIARTAIDTAIVQSHIAEDKVNAKVAALTDALKKSAEFEGLKAAIKNGGLVPPVAGQKKDPMKEGPSCGVVLKYSAQSPQFIEVIHDGKKLWIGKSMVQKYSIEVAEGVVSMLMTVAYAKKRGFL